jgi:hypothetical protein
MVLVYPSGHAGCFGLGWTAFGSGMGLWHFVLLQIRAKALNTNGTSFVAGVYSLGRVSTLPGRYRKVVPR